MNWRQVIPLAFTIAALVAGLLSILNAAGGEYMLAAQFIMLSMILDGLDGKTARLLKGTSPFGAELDTFVDITSFGVAPAVLAYQCVFSDFGIWGVMFVSFMLVSGAVRLSRFRIVDPYHGQRGYLGLPITAAAGWTALFVFVWKSGFVDEAFFSLARGPVAAFVWTGTLVMLVLQVSHIRYGKPTKELGIFVMSVCAVIFLFLRVHLAVVSALALCSFGFVYAFVTPFFPKHSIIADEDEEESVTIGHS